MSRRPWWKRKRWWVAAALWLAAIYPLSVGPVHYAVLRNWLPPSAIRWHSPLISAAARTAAAKSYSAYIEWWWRRAIRSDHVHVMCGRNGLMDVGVGN